VSETFYSNHDSQESPLPSQPEGMNLESQEEESEVKKEEALKVLQDQLETQEKEDEVLL